MKPAEVVEPSLNTPLASCSFNVVEHKGASEERAAFVFGEGANAHLHLLLLFEGAVVQFRQVPFGKKLVEGFGRRVLSLCLNWLDF